MDNRLYRQSMAAPPVKRLVDTVPRGPRDGAFYPADSLQTLFNRTWSTYHNVVPDIVRVDYRGDAAWGNRITIPMTYRNTGDMVQWLCLRIRPRSWLGADLENRLLSDKWQYEDPARAWTWANNLVAAAIAEVEFEIGDAVVERWGGEWIDVWSRAWMDAGRSGVWDADLNGARAPWDMSDTSRPHWTTFRPTADGYIYCWLPLAFMRRGLSALPLVAIAQQQEVRVHVRFRPYEQVVRRWATPRSSPDETPAGETLTLLDMSGPTPVPWTFTLSSEIPGFEEFAVFAGVVQTEDPLRSSYIQMPAEILYEEVYHIRHTVSRSLIDGSSPESPVLVSIPLTGLNGPLRELAWVIRRSRNVWTYNDWTNYGAHDEATLVQTAYDLVPGAKQVVQQPLISAARLMVNNAVWREDTERWWRLSYANNHRGGVRLSDGMVYGIVFGEETAEELQPSSTVNASQVSLRLDLFIQKPTDDVADTLDPTLSEWEVHVFGTAFNWMRFTAGQAVPLFRN